MTNFQICLCGTQPGYQHSQFCPFPYYGRETERIIQWETEFNQKKIEYNEPRPEPRKIKVEHIGDFWAGRTFPRIRIKGLWVKDAGLIPNTYVTVTNPAPGMLVLRSLEEEMINTPCQCGKWVRVYPSELPIACNHYHQIY